MDRKLQQNQEIERLIEAAHSARSYLQVEAISLKQRLDVPTRIRSSLKSHPTGWLIGSVASGLAASLIFRRRPTVTEKKRRSLPLAILGLTLTTIRPLAKVWLTDQLKNYIKGQPNKSFAPRTPNNHATSPEIF